MFFLPYFSNCPEIHIGPVGHHIQDCHGPGNVNNRSHHLWVRGSIDDILLPIESYHLYDPFDRHIEHETHFNYDRIPAVVELCIQAGVDLPKYPSRRHTAPIRMLGKKIIDQGGFIDEPKISDRAAAEAVLAELDPAAARWPLPSPPTDKRRLAERTLKAYNTEAGNEAIDEKVHGEGMWVLLGGPCGAMGPQCEAMWRIQTPVAGREARLAGCHIGGGGTSKLRISCQRPRGGSIEWGP